MGDITFGNSEYRFSETIKYWELANKKKGLLPSDHEKTFNKPSANSSSSSSSTPSLFEPPTITVTFTCYSIGLEDGGVNYTDKLNETQGRINAIYQNDLNPKKVIVVLKRLNGECIAPGVSKPVIEVDIKEIPEQNKREASMGISDVWSDHYVHFIC